MSMTLAAVGGALAGVGSKIGGGILDSAVGYAFGKRDRRDSAQQDFKQYRKQRFFDYNFDSTLGLDLAKLYDDKDYSLARRYAENSASWAVRGLRKAGLNPILAASQGFNADYGHQGVGPSGGSSMPSVGGGSSRGSSNLDLMRDLAAYSSLDVQSSTASKLRADANVAQSQSDLIKAQTLKSYVEAINEYNSKGGLQKAPIAAITKMFGSGDVNLDAIMREYSFNDESILGHEARRLGSWISKMFSPSRSTTPPTSTKDKKRFLSDLTNAVKLSNAVSPSPAPVSRKTPKEILDGEKKARDLLRRSTFLNGGR